MKNDNDNFARRLRDDADRDAPVFSDELHIRVMAAVRRENLRDRPERLRADRAESSRLWLAFLATPVAIAAMFVIWSILTRKPAKPIPQLALPDVPSVEQVVRDTADPVRQKLKDARFAYLDRDGQRLAKFLWQSVPGVKPRKTDAGSS